MHFLVFLNAQTAEEIASYKPVEYPPGYTEVLNALYTVVDGWEGKMDFYLPPSTGKPTPVVLNIHGGGWNHGVKESQTGFNTFFKEGFAVANMEYRLTGQATAPAAVEDTRCALIYIITHAKQLNFDVNKIVIMGGSSGAHLALMAGLLANDRRFDKNCTEVNDIKVAAIIDKYGIADVSDWAYGKRITSKSAINWLGDKAKDEAFVKSVSPIHFISKDSPPVFIVHGDSDPVVPYEQSAELYKKLLAAGVKTTFITVEGGLHGKFEKDKNSEINKAIIDFIKSVDAFKN